MPDTSTKSARQQRSDTLFTVRMKKKKNHEEKKRKGKAGEISLRGRHWVGRGTSACTRGRPHLHALPLYASKKKRTRLLLLLPLLLRLFQAILRGPLPSCRSSAPLDSACSDQRGPPHPREASASLLHTQKEKNKKRRTDEGLSGTHADVPRGRRDRRDEEEESEGLIGVQKSYRHSKKVKEKSRQWKEKHRAERPCPTGS